MSTTAILTAIALVSLVAALASTVLENARPHLYRISYGLYACAGFVGIYAILSMVPKS